MVRLADLHPEEAHGMTARAATLSPIELGAWITPPPLAQAKVALVTTAGLHHRSDRRFEAGLGDYRVIPDDVDPGELVMSHLSANFDRSAFQQDHNVMLPIDRLHEMAEAGEVGGVSRYHYAFMGGVPAPTTLQPGGAEVGRLLAADNVDVALLVPV